MPNTTSSSSEYESTEIMGNSILWCNKRILTGKKYYHMIYSFLLASIPLSLMLAVLIKINNSANSSIPPIVITSLLYIITIYCIIRGGCTDPGILPRQNYHYFYNTKRPTLKQLTNGHMININYCYTCSLFRPPRTSHCAECDNCVERFDHHCLWLGTCIGRRNYRFFYTLLLTLNLNGLFQIGYSIYLIVYQAKYSHNLQEYDALVFGGLAALMFFDVILMGVFVGKLLFLHTWLACSDLTFYEHIKKKWSKPPGLNPYFKRLLCRWNSSSLENIEDKDSKAEGIESSEERKVNANDNDSDCENESHCEENGNHSNKNKRTSKEEDNEHNDDPFKSKNNKEIVSNTDRNCIIVK